MCTITAKWDFSPVSCPFGVIDRRPEPLANTGGAFKCTFRYDRQKSGLFRVCKSWSDLTDLVEKSRRFAIGVGEHYPNQRRG